MAGIITILYGFGGFALAARSLGDNSFLWHLRTGELILDHGIPHRDPYSFTAAGTHWIAQSWLAELMYGALDRSIGAIGIRIAVGLAGAWVAIFLFRVGLHATNDRVRPRTRHPRARVQLLGVLGAAADVRARAARRARVHGGGADVVRRAPSARRHPDRDVALGERARHVLARLRVPRRVPRRPLARRRAAGAGERARPHRWCDRRARDLRESVRPEPRALPARAHGPQQRVEQRGRVAVGRTCTARPVFSTRSGSSSRWSLGALEAAAGRAAAHDRVPVPRLVGGAQRRDHGRGHAPGRRARVPAAPNRVPMRTRPPRRCWSWSCASSACCSSDGRSRCRTST